MNFLKICSNNKYGRCEGSENWHLPRGRPPSNRDDDDLHSRGACDLAVEVPSILVHVCLSKKPWHFASWQLSRGSHGGFILGVLMDLVDLKQMLIRIMPKKRLKMLKAEIDNDDKECDLPWGLAPALKSESTSTSNQRQQVKSTSTISMKPPDC